jgi:hypothetical protein
MIHRQHDSTRRWLLRLYPPAWRARYGDEFAALLDLAPLSLWSLLDILLGALDARWLTRDWRISTMSTLTRRLRRSEIAIFCAYIAFVVAGSAFAKITEYDDFQAATHTFPLIGIAFNTLVVAAWVALAAVVIGGAPLALAAARAALAARRWGTLALLAVPALALGALYAFVLLLTRVIGPAIHAGNGATTANYHLGIALGGFFLLCAIASTAAVARAIAQSEIAPGLYRFARIPAAVATLAMLVVTLALLVWGLGLRAYVPSLFNGNDGLLASNTAANWLVNFVAMALATGVALWAAARAFAAREGTRLVGPSRH